MGLQGLFYFVLVLLESHLLHRVFIPTGVLSERYLIQTEPLIPTVTMMIGGWLLSFFGAVTDPQAKNKAGPLLAHFVLLGIYAFFLKWLSGQYPFSPVDETNEWVRWIRQLVPGVGPMTFRFRVVSYLFNFGLVVTLLQTGRSFGRRQLTDLSISAFFGVVVGEYFFNRLIDFILWPALKGSVAHWVYWGLRPWFGNCTILDLGEAFPRVGTCQFDVYIAPQCAGLEGLMLFALALGVTLFLDRNKIKKKGAAIFAFVGLTTMYFLNVFRIWLLILIGHFYDRGFAVGAWHSYSGILIYLLGTVFVYRLAYRRLVL